MDDNDAPLFARWLRAVARVAACAVLAVVIYLLSSGPMHWLLWARSKALDDWILTVYAPLIWLDRQTGGRTPLESYVSWWSELPGGSEERYQRRLAPGATPF